MYTLRYARKFEGSRALFIIDATAAMSYVTGNSRGLSRREV